MKKIYTILGILLSIALCFSQPTFAEKMDLGVQTIPSEKQIDKTKSYFDLRVKPGEKQTISLLLSNSSDKEMKVAIETNTAVTNQNGIIDYKQPQQKPDDTLSVQFSDLISGEKEVTIGAKQTKEVDFTLTIPKTTFKGAVLGGIYVKKIETNEEKNKQKEVQIKNEYSVAIGVLLSESDEQVTSNLVLNEVHPSLENYRTVVTANIQNTQPKLEGEMTVQAEITEKGKEKVIHSTKKENMKMAPNSNFNFPISWNNEPLKPGRYTIDVSIQTSSGKWRLTKDFDIKAEESKKLNAEAVELKKDDRTLYFIIGSSSFVIILLLLLLLLKKKQTK